jgi:Fic family protein
MHRLADIVATARSGIEDARSMSDPATKTIQVMASAARFHTNCVLAQPFVDGNKRWARLLLNAFLVDCGFTPGTRIDDRRHTEYIKAIDTAARGHDDALAELITLGWIEQHQRYRIESSGPDAEIA